MLGPKYCCVSRAVLVAIIFGEEYDTYAQASDCPFRNARPLTCWRNTQASMSLMSGAGSVCPASPLRRVVVRYRARCAGDQCLGLS